jgi:hypothetical protein
MPSLVFNRQRLLGAVHYAAAPASLPRLWPSLLPSLFVSPMKQLAPSFQSFPMFISPCGPSSSSFFFFFFFCFDLLCFPRCHLKAQTTGCPCRRLGTRRKSACATSASRSTSRRRWLATSARALSCSIQTSCEHVFSHDLSFYRCHTFIYVFLSVLLS